MARATATFRRDANLVSSMVGPTVVNWGTGFKGDSLNLDVYKPVTASCPVLVLVHGGAWITPAAGALGQDRRTNTTSGPWWAIPRLYAEAGFCVVNPDYTCLGVASGNVDTTYRQGMITDLLAVMTWVRANASTYNGDPTKVCLAGFSASGQLAALVAIQGVAGGTRPDALYLASGFAKLYTYGNDTVIKNYLGIATDPSGAGLATAQAFSPVDQWASNLGIPVRIAITSAVADDAGVLSADAVALSNKIVGFGEDCILNQNTSTAHARLDWDIPLSMIWTYSKLGGVRHFSRSVASGRASAGTRTAA